MSSVTILAENISKTFRTGWSNKSNIAIADLSFSVSNGTVVGLLGPNGAGKSTTINALLGFHFLSSGRISVLGHCPGSPELLNKIGVVSEIHPILPYHSPIQQLTFLGGLSYISITQLKARINFLIERFDLGDCANRPARTFSKGMIQRLGFAQALLHDPEILILAEPTTGVDPSGRQLVAKIIQEEKLNGKTILFSTHILSDVEKLCDEVIILSKGKLSYSGHLRSSEDSWEVTFKGSPEVSLQPFAKWQPIFNSNLDVYTARNLSVVQKSELINNLVGSKIEITAVRQNRGALEDLFASVTEEKKQ